VSTLVLPHISCIASGLALLEDEQNFKLGGSVGPHKTPISCGNISSDCMK
jgi:predicted nucleic acid-binding Zn ribbon protein